ncbi:hypothetical protein ACFLYF_04750 [Chloroflexota bacterium]
MPVSRAEYAHRGYYPAGKEGCLPAKRTHYLSPQFRLRAVPPELK